ncbi:hypothetical protein [Acinetobacter seifertii]|uniref:TRASH domain-containing protein n=1 Tax=Acinetobacter seifertii TaxID=1530123 RepID=A0ABX8LA11_9GAMM|nr:hypothetical protein [Acinetobacter seifertii]QXB47693.1 hypothetical protein I6L30_06750 [Acinetobacter seifertii]
MALGNYVCAHCSKEFQRERGEANRTLKIKGYLFCSRACVGIHKRLYKTSEQKKKEKADYDRQYREKNQEALKLKKADYFKRTYNPEQAAIERKKNMHKHVEYCRQPRYKAYKQKYDQCYRAKKYYGEFWECALVLNRLEIEVRNRADFTERAILKGTLNKAQNRKRDYEQSIKCTTT